MTILTSFDFTELDVSHVMKFTARHAAEKSSAYVKVDRQNTVADIYNYEFNNMGMVLKMIEQWSWSIILRLVR